MVVSLGPKAVLATRYMVPLLIMIIMGFILKEMPVIISSQVGVIDGVITPWGGELEVHLSIPLGISCLLIFFNSLVELMKTYLGYPEELSSHSQDNNYMFILLFAGFILLILIRVPVSIAIGAAVLMTFLTSDFSDALHNSSTNIRGG